jgi:hypothetical protein
MEESRCACTTGVPTRASSGEASRRLTERLLLRRFILFVAFRKEENYIRLAREQLHEGSPDGDGDVVPEVSYAPASAALKDADAVNGCVWARASALASGVPIAMPTLPGFVVPSSGRPVAGKSGCQLGRTPRRRPEERGEAGGHVSVSPWGDDGEVPARGQRWCSPAQRT